MTSTTGHPTSTHRPPTTADLPARPRLLRRSGVLGGLVAAALVLSGSPASAADDGLPDGRRIVAHTVRSGETATGLAVRYHAWTAELISHNHLGSSAALHVGQHVEIPVVVAALRHRAHRAAPHHRTHRAAHHRLPDPRTATVRRAVAGAAHRAGVDPHLALAVAWQESGWRQGVASEAGAIGVMQLLPATGDWVAEAMLHEPVDIGELRSNVRAGVCLLAYYLARYGGDRDRALAAYYQGQRAVDMLGIYPMSRPYIASIRALEVLFTDS